MNTLSKQFVIAQNYGIPLPGSLAVQIGLNEASVRQIEERAKIMGSDPYSVFVNEVRSRIGAFLKDNNENSDVWVDMVVDFPGGASADLHFSSTAENVDKLSRSLEEIFADMSLSPEIVKLGGSWKLPIYKFDSRPAFN